MNRDKPSRHFACQIILIFCFGALATVLAEEYLHKGQARYLGWRKGKNEFRTCWNALVEIGDGKVEQTDDKCPPTEFRFVVGFPAGGGFDLYARFIARYFGKYLPDRPAVIVENMPGAGSLFAANYLYNNAPPDGRTVVSFAGSQIVNQFLGLPSVRFDARRFEWIGAPTRDVVVCVFSKASGIVTLEKWRAAGSPLRLGATQPGTVAYNTGKVLGDVLGFPVRIISGYAGAGDIMLALERGETQGTCLNWRSIRANMRKAIEAKEMFIPVQFASKPHPDLPQIPLAIEFARSEKERLLVQASISYPSEISFAYALPPNTSKERVQIVRNAFIGTVRDPEFLTAARQARLEINPLGGEEVESIVNRLFRLDPSVLGGLKEVLR